MFTYFYIAILLIVVASAIAQIRQSLRDGEPLGADPPDIDVTPLLDTSSSSHHDVPTHGDARPEGMTQADSIVAHMADLTVVVTTDA